MSRARQSDGRVHAVVVACQDADRRWLCIRRSATVAAPLKVCFPGGGIEAGESQQSAVVREMQEELGIAVKPTRCVWRWDSPTTELTLWGWIAEWAGTELKPDPAEVAEVLWLRGDEVVGHPDAMPTNRSFVSALESGATKISSEPSRFVATGARVGIRRPTESDCDEVVALARASVEFHRPWHDGLISPERFEQYLQSRQSPTEDGFLICDRSSNRIMGIINLNCIVRGFFQSTYLGYWIGASFAKQHFMTEGLSLVIRYAFDVLELHRVEANIQPGNLASIALVRKCGFAKEGYSPRYLKMFDEWRDHERWALRVDQNQPG